MSQDIGPPLVSVIIVNWNVRDLLHACLASLFEQMALPSWAFEVIVVDNASTDGSVEMIRKNFPAVRVVANSENRGFGAANNQALPMCRGRFLLLLNPDTVILGQAVDRLVEYMEERPDVGAAGCRLLNTDGSFQRWTGGGFPTLAGVASHALFLDRLLPAWLRPRSHFLHADVPDELEVDWVSGACLMLRREAVSGTIFDPAFFMYSEDVELCARLKEAGWRVMYVPSASVVHHQGKSVSQQEGEALLHSAKGPRHFFVMHHGKSALWLFDLLMVAGYLLRWGLYTLASTVASDERYRERGRVCRSLLVRTIKVMREPAPPPVERPSLKCPPAPKPELERSTSSRTG